MDIERIKTNILQAINAPCVNYVGKMLPNGISEFQGVKYIYVKIRPDDSSTRFNLCDDLVEQILEDLHEKYREHLITIKHDGLWDASYVPVFDSETQKMWDTELSEYIRNKAEWCEKYGCE